MVWEGLLKKPLEMVCTWPHLASVAMHDHRDLYHARAARLLAMVITTAGHGP
jgi:hypothetical protein